MPLAAAIVTNPNQLEPSGAPDFTVDVRWSAELVADGFTPISTFFLESYSRLSPPITHSEAMLIIHLMRYKWTKDAPYPGFTTLAKQMGISPQMARHHARSLDQKGYLRREMQIGSTNRFHLEGLFLALERHRRRELAKTAPPQPDTAAPASTLPPPTVPPVNQPSPTPRGRVRNRLAIASGRERPAS